jgi:hypothetical protein
MDKNNDNFWGILLKETYIIYNNLIKSSINERSNITNTDGVVEISSYAVITDAKVETSSNAVINN